MAPSSPKREQNGELGSSVGHSTPREKERPRSFDEKTRTACWRKAAVLTGRHPERWRQDPAGNIVCRRFWSCHGCLCYEYDHIVPFSKGGKSTVDNCQILQTRVNRSKSDKAWVEQAEMQGFSCDMKFTGGLRTLLYNHCRIKEVNELFQFRIMQLSSDLLEFWSDKELDIIEMAVYGDVVRPGKQCRCRTVAEMLGKVKSKDHMPPCDLPYNDAS